jgi:GT2 family glycosyltransferase
MDLAAMNPSAPLRDLRWNGHTLDVEADAGTPLALYLDGARFVEWPPREDGRYAQSFAFAPGGDTRMLVEVRHHDLPLHAPLQVEWGRPGFAEAHGAAPPLMPLDAAAEERLDAAAALGRARASTVDIIVPVYNAAAAVARCLTALRQHTPSGARLWLIDDASTDAGVAPLLAMAAAWPNVRVLANRRNRGYTATVNRGLREVGRGDVVLLNADTEVGPGWLGALRRAAYARVDTASATAVSDNAGAFSVPELEQHNLLPLRWNPADATRALLHDAGLAFPRLPTGNGFCMYMRGDARAEVGELDAKAFPQGYGEENDWSQRAEKRGWRHVIAGNAFVVHARSQSFGEQRRYELGALGMQVLRKRYPGYEAAVGAQLFSWQRRVLDWRVRRLWTAANVAPRARVLLTDVAQSTAWSGWEAWHVRRDGASLCLLDADACERERAADDERLDACAAWLQRYGFEAAAVPPDDTIAAICAAFGIGVAATPAGLRWALQR